MNNFLPRIYFYPYSWQRLAPHEWVNGLFITIYPAHRKAFKKQTVEYLHRTEASQLIQSAKKKARMSALVECLAIFQANQLDSETILKTLIEKEKESDETSVQE